MLWAVKNGMTGVNMQRRPGTAWDDPAKDVALVVQWVHNNISRYKGNPKRVFILVAIRREIFRSALTLDTTGILRTAGRGPERRDPDVAAELRHSARDAASSSGRARWIRGLRWWRGCSGRCNCSGGGSRRC